MTKKIIFFDIDGTLLDEEKELPDSTYESIQNLQEKVMALYIIRYNKGNHFVTPEPLGPGGDPYPPMHAKPDEAKLTHLVQQTATYFREREEQVLTLI